MIKLNSNNNRNIKELQDLIQIKFHQLSLKLKKTKYKNNLNYQKVYIKVIT
jgi:hypothetical protein